MIKFKKSGFVHSLYFKLFFTVFFAVCISVLSFVLTRFFANDYIEEVYASEERKGERERETIEALQGYVNENSLSSANTDRIASWSKDNKYVYLLIYKNDELFFSSDMLPQKPSGGDTGGESGEGGSEGKDDSFGSGITVDFPTREELREYAEKNDLYELEMSDGMLFASIAEFSEYFYYDLVNILSLVFAAVVLAVILLINFRNIISRIKKLDRSVMVVAEGNINAEITHKGYDEIARLSGNVENMRRSILEGIEEERRARQANTELITAMSHDIRTPLTVLMGYLDVMKESTEDEAMLSYLEASEKTALRLKNLSDDLFNYFLAYGSAKENLELESYDALTLIEQILSEQLLILTEEGFNVELKRDTDAIPAGALAVTDAPKLMRIVDNMFSNIKKYADKTKPVEIFAGYNEGIFRLEMENHILEGGSLIESNGIGLKTCTRLAGLLGGSFEYKRIGRRFKVSMSFGILSKDKE